VVEMCNLQHAPTKNGQHLMEERDGRYTLNYKRTNCINSGLLNRKETSLVVIFFNKCSALLLAALLHFSQGIKYIFFSNETSFKKQNNFDI
jgi:hypothetical protein